MSEIWNGSSWNEILGMEVWNGSKWIEATGYEVWNGSTWNELSFGIERLFVRYNGGSNQRYNSEINPNTLDIINSNLTYGNDLGGIRGRLFETYHEPSGTYDINELNPNTFGVITKINNNYTRRVIGGLRNAIYSCDHRNVYEVNLNTFTDIKSNPTAYSYNTDVGGTNSKLYVTTYQWSKDDDSSGGYIYELNSSTFEKINSIYLGAWHKGLGVEGMNDRLYSVGTGGSNYAGLIYEVNPDTLIEIKQKGLNGASCIAGIKK